MYSYAIYRSKARGNKIGVEGVPHSHVSVRVLSCWYLRVTLTPERPSYNSIVHSGLLYPAH